MEDSVESDICLVVPASAENSEVPLHVGNVENPLGITLGSSSFSCFELSGKGSDVQEESSESLHLDEKDVIPPSPSELHIDVDSTPSHNASFNGSTVTSVHESYEGSETESGRMSPDLIASSDVSSTEMLSSYPKTGEKSQETIDSKNDVVSSNVSTESNEDVFASMDVMKPIEKENIKKASDLENYYEADTETYTESNFPPITMAENSNSISNFLQKCASINDNPSPIILTANTNTQTDSENNKVMDLLGKEPSAEPNTENLCLTNNVITVSDKNIGVADNNMGANVTNKDMADNVDNNMGVADDSKDVGDINMGVTDGEMGVSGIDQGKVENEEIDKGRNTFDLERTGEIGGMSDQESNMGESMNIGVTENLRPGHENGYANVTADLDSQKVIYKDVSMRKIEDEDAQNKTDEESQKGFLIGQGVETQEFTQEDLNLHLTFESQLFDNSIPTVESQCLINDEGSQISNPTSTKSQNNDSQSEKTPDNSSQKCPKNMENSSNENVNFTSSTTIASSDTQKEADDFNMADSVNSTDSKYDSIKVPTTTNVQDTPEPQSQSNIGNKKGTSSPVTPLPDLASENDDKMEISPKIAPSSNSDPVLEMNDSRLSCDDSIVKPNNQREICKGKNSEVNIEQSETTLKSKPGSQEVSPSMQSTYIDENNNFNNNNNSQTPHNESINDSIDCSLPTPTGNSYDASIENSSLEQDMDLPMCDLETQPFTMTPGKDLTSERSESQNIPPETESQSQNIANTNTQDSVNIVKELLTEIITSVENKSTDAYKNSEILTSNTKVDNLELVVEKDDTLKIITNNTEEVALKAFEYRSQSQPSQDIHLLKSPFRSPTEPRVRSGSKDPNKKSEVKMDGNNNVAKETGKLATEKHDTSSDTIPTEDISDQASGNDSDPLVPPNKGEIVTYKVTRYAVVETIVNGVVIDTKTNHKHPKFYKTNPYPSSSSQSSNSSGYLADTSSISRTSSDTTTQTDLSPGHRARRFSHEPAAIPRDLSGGSSSSSGSSTVFIIPGSGVHPPKSMKSLLRESQNISPDSKSSEKASSPMVTSASSSPSKSSSSTSIHSGLGMGESPALKEGRVILTPLSTELIRETKASGNVATPPLLININPPLSGSTPMQKDDSTSDLTTSNSPEIQYPTDSLHGISSQSFPYDDTANLEKNDSAEIRVQLQNENTPTAQNADVISSPTKTPKGGIPVMARPARESYFYPGLLQTQQPESGKYTVFFEDDGKDRQIRENDILLIDMLPVGQEVYAQSDSEDPTGWYSAGTIFGFWRENDSRGYVIQKPEQDTKTDQTRKYTRKQVIVKHESLPNNLTKLRVQPIPGVTTADVSLDNIMDGKRRSRKSIAESSAASSPASSHGAQTPLTPRTPRSSRKRHVEDSQSSASSSVPFPSSKKSKRAKLTYGSPRRSRTQSKQEEPKALTRSNIFENCGFLLTSTTGKDHPSSEMESPPCTDFGYSRDITRKRISAGNGLIARSFNQLMSCDRQHRYVISDSYCRTMNYFTALAAGIDCVSHLWINHSTEIGQLKQTHAYLLPAGYSLQHQRTVERLPVLVQPLSGLRISLHLKDISTWNPLLCIAGCIVVSSRKDVAKKECALSCDVVVADLSCDNSIKDRAKNLDIPIVSIEWIIQCLITSEKLPFDGHHQYTCFT